MGCEIAAAETAPAATLVANANWLAYTIRYVVKYTNRRNMKAQLYNRIMNEIDQTDGQAAEASTTIHIVETPTFNIHLNGKYAAPES